jgi:Putative Actinobacterial Holin-X, holin superfamily III
MAVQPQLRGIAMNSASDRSIPTLVSDAFAQLAKLVSNEFELAKAEAVDKVGQIGRGAAIIGTGALLMLPGVTILLFAAAAGLIRAGFSDPVAYLLTAVATLVVAGALVAVGINRLSGDALKPQVMIDQLQQDKAAVKEMVR